MLHRSNIKKRKRYSASRTSSSTFTLGKSNTLHSKSTYFYRWGSYLVPGMCGLAFLVGLGLAINPLTSITNQANAEEAIYPPSGDPTISLKIGGTQNGTPTEVVVGAPSYRMNTLTVTGKGIGRYSLYINTAAGSTGELVGRTHPYATVVRTEDGLQGDSLADNTWGYHFQAGTISSCEGDTCGDLQYYAAPDGTSNERSVELIEKRNITYDRDNKAFSDTYSLIFAAKLGDSMPSDHYETNVYISTIADAYFTTATGITTSDGQTIYAMQEMTQAYCNAINQDAKNITLEDSRDGKVYFVSKMKDGNCWMTQNLDYDIEQTLYPATSDVTEKTTMRTIAVSNPADWTASDAESDYYYDPDQDLERGQHYYYTYPGHERSNSCSSTPNGLSDCTKNKQFTPQVLEDNSEENHYIVGNYYSWYAATAGSGKSAIVSGRADNSICPRNWKLPANADTSFNGLIGSYGISGSTLVSNGKSLYAEPLYFVYGGEVLGGTLDYAGNHGFYWSSTTVSSGLAYNLTLRSDVNPLSSNGRSCGMSVRCVFNAN